MTIGNSILSDRQRALLSAALNRIIPAQGEMPAAGDLGIADFVASVASGSSAKRRALLDGLVRIDLAAAYQVDKFIGLGLLDRLVRVDLTVAERGGAFAILPADAQAATLREVEADAPEFFQELVTQTYRGYYTNETVFARLSYRAPNREGYAPIPFDESLLEPVRQRGQMWVPTDS